MAHGSRGSGFAGEWKAWHSGLQRGAAEQVGWGAPGDGLPDLDGKMYSFYMGFTIWLFNIAMENHIFL